MRLAPIIAKLGPFGLYPAARLITRNHPRILMYHRFQTSGTAGLTAETFDCQVRYIARYFNPMSLGELLGYLRTNRSPPPHSIVITVDDGHRDFLDVAWPVLRQNRVPATLFVTTGFIDGELWLWPDQISWILDRCGPLPSIIDLGGSTLRPGAAPWQSIIDHILTLPDHRRRCAPDELAAQVACYPPNTPPDGYQPVTWDELRMLEGNGIEIGGHTHTHPNLARVPLEQLPSEITRCRERLDDELGEATRPFCYPNGQLDDVTADVVSAVAYAGFTGAVLAYADDATHHDLYYLRRHGSSANMFQFYKASSGLEWLGRRWRKRAAA